jgi:NAD(P)-dependent dehydrogenase (short-subunit alcohol dehydrogenase family)
MKVLVIGATGIIGSAIVKALRAQEHEVVEASRKGSVAIDIDDPAALRKGLAEVGTVDHIVCAAGNAAFKAFDELSDEDFAFSLRSKLMGQVNVVRFGHPHVVDGGSITITTGALAHRPMKATAAIAMVNGGLESFVRAAALEMPRGIRVNAVSPPWVKETLEKLNMDPKSGLPADKLAEDYLALLVGKQHGETHFAWS